MDLQKNKILSTQNFHNLYPNENTPVSYDNLGNIVSTFKDDIWDFSHYIYNPSSRKKFNFNTFKECKNKELRHKIIYEYKIIIYGFIYCNTFSAKSFCIQTIFSSYNPCLKKIFSLAIQCNCVLSGISQNNFLINNIFHYLTLIDRKKYGSFSHIFKKLNALSTIFKNHDFSLNNEQFSRLLKLKHLLKDGGTRQNLVIPTRIYLKLNNFIDQKIKDFNKNYIYISKLFINYKHPNKFKKDLSNIDINNFFSLNNIFDFRDLKFYVSRIKYLALAKIIMFSGMRHAEALLLPYDCYEIIELNNKQVYTLTGYTSKFTNFGPVKTTWITSLEIAESIKTLKSITDMFLSYLKIDEIDRDPKKIPLACYIPRQPNKTSYIHPIYKYPVSNTIPLKNVLTDLNFDLKILKGDMNELERTISFNSDDNYNDINIGLDFPITVHQFRRSLTVYAARSGIVNIPALKAQLKHIKQDMTLYYARNSMDTVNIFDQDLINIFNDEINLEKFLNFSDDVMNTTDKLYGGEGSRLQNAKDSTNIPFFLSDEQTALQNIKAGKLSYKRTPLGGCSKIGRCEDITELTITACITCQNAIFSSRTNEALKIALKSFKNQLRLFPENSPLNSHQNSRHT